MGNLRVIQLISFMEWCHLCLYKQRITFFTLVVKDAKVSFDEQSSMVSNTLAKMEKEIAICSMLESDNDVKNVES